MKRLALIALMLTAVAASGMSVRMQMLLWDSAYVAAGDSTIPLDGLLHFWNMDNVSGTAVYDEIGSATGTLSSAAMIDADYGKYSAGMRTALTGGVNAYMDTTVAGLSGVTNATVMMWWRHTQSQGSARYAYYQLLNANDQNAIAMLGSTTLGVYFSKSGSGSFSIADFYNATGVDYGEWHHYCAVFDGALTTNERIKFYLDGVRLSPSAYAAGNTTLSSSLPSLLRIGQHYNNNTSADIDDFAIYDRSLSSNEVYSVYSENQTYAP